MKVGEDGKLRPAGQGFVYWCSRCEKETRPLLVGSVGLACMNRAPGTVLGMPLECRSGRVREIPEAMVPNVP